MAKTERDFEVERRRRAWWLFVFRRVRGMNQSGVAKAVGLKATSASTVGDWERGVSDPSLRQLHDLAVVYDVPFSFLKNPPATDEERAAEAMGIDPYEDEAEPARLRAAR